MVDFPPRACPSWRVGGGPPRLLSAWYLRLRNRQPSVFLPLDCRLAPTGLLYSDATNTCHCDDRKQGELA